MDNTERQLREADAAVDKAVADFISQIETMSGRWDAVAPAYILESVLLALCEEMTRLIDDPDLANVMGEAMLKAIRCAGRLPGFARRGGSLSPQGHARTPPCVIFVGDLHGFPRPPHHSSLQSPARSAVSLTGSSREAMRQSPCA